MKRVRFKICGIKNLHEARLAIQAGADMLGFVFAEGRHKVSWEQVLPIAREIPFHVLKVGVFVNAPPEQVRRTADYCRLEVLQFHGEESPSYCRQFSQKVIKAFPVATKDDLAPLATYRVDAYLLDARVKGLRGGTGQVLPWEMVKEINLLPAPLILAGGLTPQNIRKALQKTGVNIVDVSSGVESSGQKDYLLLQQLSQAIRSYERDAF